MVNQYRCFPIRLFFNMLAGMNLYRTVFLWLLLLLVAGACKDVYYPGELDSSVKIPVIQGIILQGQAPVVTLSWAMRYNDQQTTYISDANVSVTDDLGNSVKLYGYGTYTSYGMVGAVGRSYSLQVDLSDGSSYTSSFVAMPKPPVIDSIYAQPVRKTVYTYGADNLLVPEDQQGLNILADLSGEGDTTLYYRFNTNVVKEMIINIGHGLGMYSQYLWQVSTLDNSYSVDYTVSHDNRQVLMQHTIGFLRYFYDASIETPNQSAPYTQGWVLTCNVYAIPADVYDYYNAITSQLNGNDQIFAPVPVQVNGNIHCTSKPGSSVLGVFEAASVSTIYKAFFWRDLNSYRSKVLNSFPSGIGNGSENFFPPSFWVISN